MNTYLNATSNNYSNYLNYQNRVKHNERAAKSAINESVFASTSKQKCNEVAFKALNPNFMKTLMIPALTGAFVTIASAFNEKKDSVENEECFAASAGAKAVQGSPSTYRAKLPTPDYSHTRENFPSDAYQSTSKSGKAIAYTTNGHEDGIVYRDAEGKLRVPNKWDKDHPYEVSDGTDGKPASVIMIYDEAGGDFAVGDPDTIASTYKNPVTGELDPLYDTPTGRKNAFEIHKDEVPSAYKFVPEGTELQTKEGARIVQKDEVVVYDTDGDPYVMPLKNFLKRQTPLAGDSKSQAVYAKLQTAQKDGTGIPAELMVKDGNATSKNAKTYKS